MYFIGLDIHKKTISYCVKDVAGHVHQEGKFGSTRRELDIWLRTVPQPRTIAMEATMFTGWIYDHLLPHAEKVKVANPLMLRAIAASKTTEWISISMFGCEGSSRNDSSVLAFWNRWMVALCNWFEKKLNDSAKSRCKVAWLRP